MSNYIKHLHVENVGMFNRLDISFSPRMNVIFGTNGSGKTSILRCLSFCCSQSKYENSRFRKGASFWMDTEVEGELKRIGGEHLFDNDTQYRVSNISSWHKAPIVENIKNDNILLPFNPQYHLYAIGAYRTFSYVQIDGMKKEPNAESALRNFASSNAERLDTSNLPNIKQWMINRYFVIDKDWAVFEKENWNIMMNTLPHIVPPGSEFYFSRIERDLEPIFTINGAECYLEELSGGYKSVLSIIMSIIDWCEETNEGEQKLIKNSEGTVLIDEIDVHLHPEWQASILKILKRMFPQLQFIVTTHSPYVLASAECNELIKIGISGNREFDLHPDERSYGGWTLNYILSDLMGVPEADDEESLGLINALDNAIEKKEYQEFDKAYMALSNRLHTDDPRLLYYKMRKAKTLLQQ